MVDYFSFPLSEVTVGEQKEEWQIAKQNWIENESILGLMGKSWEGDTALRKIKTKKKIKNGAAN